MIHTDELLDQTLPVYQSERRLLKNELELILFNIEMLD
jgi:hypothetical protein